MNKKLSILFSTFLSVVCAATCPVENVTDYHDQTLYQKSAANELLKGYVAAGYLSGAERILDYCIECNDGKIAANIASYVPQGGVLGVDSSNQMINFARLTYKTSPNNLAFEVIDLKKLNFKEEFDIVTSFTALHRVEHQSDLLKDFRCALKENGLFLAQFPVTHGFDTALDELMLEPRWAQYFVDFSSGWHFTTLADYHKLLKSTGFQIKRIEVTQLDEVYPSTSAFISSIGTWLPHLSVLPEEKRQEFLKQLVSLFIEKHQLDEAGRLHYVVDRLEVEAVARGAH